MGRTYTELPITIWLIIKAKYTVLVVLVDVLATPVGHSAPAPHPSPEPRTENSKKTYVFLSSSKKTYVFLISWVSVQTTKKTCVFFLIGLNTQTHVKNAKKRT